MNGKNVWARLGLVALLSAAACDCDEEDPVAFDAGMRDSGMTDSGMVVTPSLVITPAEGLETSEDGTTAEFTIALGARPSANVSIGLASSDDGEITVEPAALTFTSANWMAPQTVRLTGVDDDEADGPQVVTIATAPAVSTDPNYRAFDGPDIEATNIDNDTAGFTVTPTEGLMTSEDGGTAELTIALTTAPAADVVVGLSTSDESEGTVSPDSLTFTTENWNAPQTVTVTGVDDNELDGDVTYMVLTGAATSDDEAYAELDPADATAVNADNDTAGLVVDTMMMDLETRETGAAATFTVALRNQPTADVVVPVVTGDDTEGTVAPAELTFTTENWDAPQTVTVTGVDDDVADGNVMYNVTLGPPMTTDEGYGMLMAVDVAVQNIDDETAGFTVTPMMGLETTEAGGAAEFTFALNSEPTADVTITLSSSDDTEATPSPAELTFTPMNWDAPQTVTVTGVDDDIADGSQPWRVTAEAASDDMGYDELLTPEVSGNNLDDETAGITVDAEPGLTTTEAGGAATFTVVLNSQPTADVVVPISSDDTGEGTVSAMALTFTSMNWDAPQTVTVTGADDDLADGDQAYSVVIGAATSADAGYAGIDPRDVAFTNTDDETAGVTVAPTTGLVTTEAGGTAEFTVVLNSEPTGDVTIPLSSSDTSEGTITLTQLVFTADNWNSPQPVEVTGADDFFADGAQVYEIETGAATSTDADYSGFDPADVELRNTDNETAGVTVSPTDGLTTTEAGGTAEFTVVLNSEPTADVTIPVASSDTSEGTITVTELVFTPLDWDSPQTVEVTGEDDFLADGPQVYEIETGAATSADGDYSAFDAADVELRNTDNETAGITVTPTGGLTTTEAGATASFDIVLDSQPTADVTIPLDSSDTTEGTIAVTEVVFTPANWDGPQTVTVTGADDFLDDGAQTYRIITGAATSMDPNYAGFNAADVVLSNTDNETAGITVDADPDLETGEGGALVTFTVVLNSQPTGDVTIPLSSSDTTEGSVSPPELVFTNVNWAAPQPVTVTGVDDMIRDRNQTYQAVIGAASSTDGDYDGRDAPDVTITNIDDESGGAVLSATDVTTGEDGTTGAFTIVLISMPTDDVTIPLTSTDTTEGTVVASVTFTPMNWDVPQTVTVTGVDDDVEDGNQAYEIQTGLAVSADSNYADLNAANVSATNIDDDTAGIRVDPVDGLTTNEGGGTDLFTIVLNSEPTALVTIPLTSSNTAEGTVQLQVTFDDTNWNVPQDITVTGVDDAVADGDQVYSIRTGAATSTDPNYNGIDADDVDVTNQDDDSPGIIVTPTRGLTTTELGGTDDFSVVLTSEPTATVTIELSSTNPFEGQITPTTLIFTAANWDVPQVVTLTGQDDTASDGTQLYFVETDPATSMDPDYDGRNAADVEAFNIDDETAGITVSETSVTTGEDGTSDTFTVVLNREPTADVIVPLRSTNTSEGTVSPASLTFTNMNWDTPQTVTVMGVDDMVDDGDQPYAIVTEPAMSTDLTYEGVNGSDVAATNVDDDP